MATLFTSCFGRVHGKSVPLVAITHRTPPGWSKAAYTRLAPNREMRRLKPEKFAHDFEKYVLGKLDPHEMLELLDGSILCSYEKPGEFSHRRIVAEWIQKHCAIEVPEWGWHVRVPTVAEMLAATKQKRIEQLTFL